MSQVRLWHKRAQRRYVCHACKRTFANTMGAMLQGLKHPLWLLLVVVLAFLAYGCPLPVSVTTSWASPTTMVGSWEDLRYWARCQAAPRRLLIGISHCLAQGYPAWAEAILQTRQIEEGRTNTRYIERLNATLHTWLPALLRRTRTPSAPVKG